MNGVKVARCPAWCAEEHQRTDPTFHSSRAALLPLISDDSGSQYVEVRVAQYVKPVDEDTDHWRAVIEIAHHAGGRYRILNLTPVNARKLAAALLELADELAAPGSTLS